jgi:phospholipase/carboxylesterase
MTELNGPELLPADSAVNSLIVMLHGFGANGADLIALAPYFQRTLQQTAFHSPDGAQVCEMTPMGRQWFSLARYDPEYLRRHTDSQQYAFEAMYEGACDTAPVIENYIKGLREHYKLPPEKVALVGFSQGTMMALHIALRQTSPYAAVVGFSGALVGADRLAQDIQSKCPTLLIHGQEDDMLPVNAVDLAQRALETVDITPQVIKRPGLTHSIDVTGIKAATNFLSTHLHK